MTGKLTIADEQVNAPSVTPHATPLENTLLAAKASPVVGLSGRVAGGFLAAVTSALLCRAVGLVGQLVLAWYLTKQDFGIAAVAVSASILITLVREVGIVAMLSRHPSAYPRWAADAFWLSVVVSVLGALCLAAATPIIARQTHMPGIIWPTLLLAGSWIFATPSTIPLTGLSIQMRFRASANIVTVTTLLTTLFGMALAYFRAGAYAIVLPMVGLGVLRLCVGLVMSPIPLWRRPQFSRWWVMLAYGWPLFISTLCVTIAMQGDNLILGHFQTEATVGVYYFAYQIVVQLLGLLGQNIGAVLLPVFGHIRNDLRRQRDAFVRACGLLIAIAFPPFFLQAALAEPLLRLFWRDKWVDAALPLSILSIGTAFRLLGTIATPYIWSRGRLREYLIFTVLSAIAFVVIVTIGAQIGTTVGVSIAVTVYYSISETAFAVMALVDRHQGFGRRRAVKELALVLLMPLSIGVAVLGTTWPFARWIELHWAGQTGALLATVIGGAWGVALQAALMWIFCRELVRDAVARILAVLTPLGRSPALRKLAGLPLLSA